MRPPALIQAALPYSQNPESAHCPLLLAPCRLNGNGNRSLHDCSLPVLTGSVVSAAVSGCPVGSTTAASGP